MDDKKIIINVGRQLGAGGRTIAKRLSETFGCKFYDKELLNLAAKESGFSESFFEQHDEHKRFFKSLFHLHTQHLSDNNFYTNKFSEESLFQFQAEAILKAASEGNCVFVGRCADYILRDDPDAISVFITVVEIGFITVIPIGVCITDDAYLLHSLLLLFLSRMNCAMNWAVHSRPRTEELTDKS